MGRRLLENAAPPAPERTALLSHLELPVGGIPAGSIIVSSSGPTAAQHHGGEREAASAVVQQPGGATKEPRGIGRCTKGVRGITCRCTRDELGAGACR